MIYKWCDFINESSDDKFLLGIIKKYDYDRLYVVSDINKPIVKEYIDNKLRKVSDKLYNQDSIIRNFLNYYSDINYDYSEVVKLEYGKHDWIILGACYVNDEKFAYITASPDMIDTSTYKDIFGDIVGNGYFITKSKDITHNFIHALVSVFRNLSSRKYNFTLLQITSDMFTDFKNKYKSEWRKYTIWKNNTLGEKIKCVRFIDLQPSFKVKLVSGGYKKISDLTIMDNFYYPISKRAFSQWALLGGKISKIKNDFDNINSTTDLGFISYIPSNKVVLTNGLIPHNFSPHVNEREVIVEHNINDEYDTNIVCRVI